MAALPTRRTYLQVACSAEAGEVLTWFQMVTSTSASGALLTNYKYRCCSVSPFLAPSPPSPPPPASIEPSTKQFRLVDRVGSGCLAAVPFTSKIFPPANTSASAAFYNVQVYERTERSLQLCRSESPWSSVAPALAASTPDANSPHLLHADCAMQHL